MNIIRRNNTRRNLPDAAPVMNADPRRNDDMIKPLAWMNQNQELVSGVQSHVADIAAKHSVQEWNSGYSDRFTPQTGVGLLFAASEGT